MPVFHLTFRLFLLSCYFFAAGLINVGLAEEGTVVETMQLATLLAERDAEEATPKKRVVLVDCRSKEETGVSLIPGAITKETFEKDREKFDGLPVVVYCLSGGRSGLYAKRLAGEGVDVRNYRGSIIAWVQAKQPLVAPSGEPTSRVHTYGNPFALPDGYEAVGD